MAKDDTNNTPAPEEDTTTDTKISDDEALYRSVRGTIEHSEYEYSSGSLIITRHAFKDAQKCPSVDRANILKHTPAKAKKSKTDGVVTILTSDVRKIGDVHTQIDADESIFHSVDVVADPIKDDPTLPDNPAHALVTVTPYFFGSKNKQKNAFKLLRISLARLATKNGWTITPTKP